VITVVNRRVQKRTALPPGTVRVYVGRPSPLGNPFNIGRDGTREQVIKRYEDWLRQHLVRGNTEPQNDVRKAFNYIFMEDLVGGVNLELECWCAPLPCHAEVIKKLIQEELEQGLQEANQRMAVRHARESRNGNLNHTVPKT